MKVLLGLMLTIIFSGEVYSMPCDAGYFCVSKTGDYKVSLQRCRYRNNINLISTKINNVDVPEATLNKGWDGENILAFEIKLPVTEEGAVKILTAEISTNHRHGLMKIKYAASEPGPLSVLHSEKMFCNMVE